MRPKYIASCSFGKDSIATILLALENKEPLDEIVYCEVMFDENISGEAPEHRDFIYNKAIPFMISHGLKVNVLRESNQNYIKKFYHIIVRGPRKGKVMGFPLCGKCYVQRDLKIPPINRYKKTLPPGTIQYLGIAADEPKRLQRLDTGKISLLDKYHYTEQMAKQKCIEYGLLSPLYEFSDRGGCWFCPNAGHRELRHIYDFHKDLWQRMLELQEVPNKCKEEFNFKFKFSDIDRRFKIEDLAQSLF